MLPAPGLRCVSAGQAILDKYPDTPGSLGIAISEAIEAAVTDETGSTRYSLGSVLNHVMLHQTIIGQEVKKQLEIFGEKTPDVVIGCAGGGSNFAGIAIVPSLSALSNSTEVVIVVSKSEAEIFKFLDVDYSFLTSVMIPSASRFGLFLWI